MGRRFILIPLLVIFFFFSCHIFLGPDPENNPMAIFDRIWTDFDEKYALFDIRGIDWNEKRKIYSSKISPDMDDYELFNVCADMLNSLKDPHVFLTSSFNHSYFLNFPGMDFYDLYYRSEEPFSPFSLYLIRDEYLDNRGIDVGNGRIIYGRIKLVKSLRPVGYIYISDFLDFNFGLDIIPGWVKEIDGIIEYLSDTDLLVLDVRNNNGGLGSNVNYIASRFASAQEDYIKSCTKNGPGRGDFTDPITWTLKPAGTRYTKPVVLLTNKETVSAGEWFTLALKTQSHITHVGETTRGAFSARLVRPLVNGWEYTIAVQKILNMANVCLEGVGIVPDREIENTWDKIDGRYFQAEDTQLEYALRFRATP
jgi:hypothetical protein